MFICNHCNTEFKSLKSLSNHKRTIKNNVTEVENIDGLVKKKII